MKHLLTLALLASSVVAAAEDSPLWMRYPAISPDGTTIAFTYRGDLYTVSSAGGAAQQLTTNAAYDSYPVWSPDGRQVAFASDREGSLDVYVISRYGGVPRRLTTNSAAEVPMAWSDSTQVLYRASGMPSAESIVFASGTFEQVYEVGADGSRPRLFSSLTMEDIDINARGDILYHDKKGYEDPWRKHQQSPIARDIWLSSGGKHTRLTAFGGEDRTPRWAADGQHYYYLSEQDGTFNVYRRALDGSAPLQLTHFKGNPVRFLSVSRGGTLCYGYDGEIYTQADGGAPSRLRVSITADSNDRALQRQIFTGGLTEFALSPGGKEIAFVHHGDVYVTSLDYATTKQITDTPEQERDISFSPDGRSIVYASERGGLWQIYQTSLKKKEEKAFTYATELEEEQLVKSTHTSQMPEYSPDGRQIAFFEDRATLRVLDVKSRKVTTLMDGKYLYSYSDGDLWYQWGPDSRWLLAPYLGHGGWQSPDIALVKADGKGEIHNLTQSGYSDGSAKWVLGGKAMLFSSDRAGYRSHGSWGTENDEYIMFFDLEAYEQFRMSKEEKGLYDEAEKARKAEQEKAESDPAKKKAVKKDTLLHFDLDNCRDRVLRLTVNSSRLGDAVLSKDGAVLYYLAAFEGDYDLWKHDLKDHSTSILVKGAGGGGLLADKDVTKLYLSSGSGISEIALPGGARKAITFEGRFNYRPREERAYLFNHIWQQVKDKFYDAKLHGVDWDGCRKTYEKFLPHISNNYDFRDMLSEMLGELNASHTGARYYAPGRSLPTATLGLFFDESFTGDGLRVKEVLKRGPFALKPTGVRPGCVITALDGEKILRGKDYNALLDGKAGKPLRVSVADGKRQFDVVVKPISASQQQELLYRRWVERNRRLVDSLSHGRVAYVHVKAMDSESYRTVFRELLSDENRQRDAVIVDERHNGGGWLHDDLCTLLSGKEYQKFIPQGKYIGSDPWNKWTKRSCVLMCEDDYSNGSGFPFVYKELGIGPLIGTPVAGTMTAVWWERLMDSSLVFGIPQVGCQDMRGHFNENRPVNPDITVYNTPEDYLSGHDRQLERAVQEMMKKQ